MVVDTIRCVDTEASSPIKELVSVSSGDCVKGGIRPGQVQYKSNTGPHRDKQHNVHVLTHTKRQLVAN